jgi:uncharacterized phage protein (TIGR02218 family)
VLGADTYTQAAIKAGNIRQSGDLVRNDLKLTVPWDFPIAELWRLSPPSTTMAVILKEVHAGDGEIVQSWTGHVSNVSWPSPAEAELMLSPGVVAMRSTGLRMAYQRSCPHVTFGAACGVDKVLFRAAGTVLANAGVTVQAAVFALQADGYYNGGFIEWTDADGITTHRFITAHVGNTVTLMTPAVLLAVNDAFDAFPGDDHTLATCAGKFNNAPNYGGIPYFTQRNPFDGNPVY